MPPAEDIGVSAARTVEFGIAVVERPDNEKPSARIFGGASFSWPPHDAIVSCPCSRDHCSTRGKRAKRWRAEKVTLSRWAKALARRARNRADCCRKLPSRAGALLCRARATRAVSPTIKAPALTDMVNADSGPDFLRRMKVPRKCFPARFSNGVPDRDATKCGRVEFQDFSLGPKIKKNDLVSCRARLLEPKDRSPGRCYPRRAPAADEIDRVRAIQ